MLPMDRGDKRLGWSQRTTAHHSPNTWSCSLAALMQQHVRWLTWSRHYHTTSALIFYSLGLIRHTCNREPWSSLPFHTSLLTETRLPTHIHRHKTHTNATCTLVKTERRNTRVKEKEERRKRAWERKNARRMRMSADQTNQSHASS